MRSFWDKYHEGIITFLLFSVVFIVIASVISLVSGTIMSFFGFEYDSVGSIILFFIIASIISYPISLIAEILPKVLLHFGKISKNYALLIYVILDTLATSLGLVVVDIIMKSVSATGISIIVISLLLSLIGVKDI